MGRLSQERFLQAVCAPPFNQSRSDAEKKLEFQTVDHPVVTEESLVIVLRQLGLGDYQRQILALARGEKVDLENIQLSSDDDDVDLTLPVARNP